MQKQIQIEQSLQHFQLHKMKLENELEQMRLDHDFRCKQLAVQVLERHVYIKRASHICLLLIRYLNIILQWQLSM